VICLDIYNARIAADLRGWLEREAIARHGRRSGRSVTPAGQRE
jgi:hypothetical protein